MWARGMPAIFGAGAARFLRGVNVRAPKRRNLKPIPSIRRSSSRPSARCLHLTLGGCNKERGRLSRRPVSVEPTALRAMAQALYRRGFKSSRGGAWHPSSVATIRPDDPECP